MRESTRDDLDLSDILDGSMSEKTKRAGKVAGRVREDYETYKHESEVLGAVLEKTPTLQQQREGRIVSGILDDYRAYQGRKMPTEVVQKREEKIAEQQKVREPVKVEGIRLAHQKIPEPVIKESDKTGKKTPKKAGAILEGSLLDESLSGSKKIREPVVVEKVKSEEKKLQISVKKSQEEKEQIFEQSSIEEVQALLHKEESTGGYLYVLGNILLGVVSLGIVHAIFYIGSLIAFGAQLQKWESKDPITWFFHRLNAKVVFKTEADVKGDDFSADEISCGV